LNHQNVSILQFTFSNKCKSFKESKFGQIFLLLQWLPSYGQWKYISLENKSRENKYFLLQAPKLSLSALGSQCLEIVKIV
jgi:hypothetical protein